VTTIQLNRAELVALCATLQAAKRVALQDGLREFAILIEQQHLRLMNYYNANEPDFRTGCEFYSETIRERDELLEVVEAERVW
jgi:hypothetical protein